MSDAGSSSPGAVAGIVFHPEYLALEERGKTVKVVRREQIESVTLEHGFFSHHPMVQIAFGLVLAAVGTLPALWVLRWQSEGGTLDVWYFVVVLLLPLGLWVIRDAMRRGLLLVLRGRSETHRLPLPPSNDPGSLHGQLTAAAVPAGYTVEVGASVEGDVGEGPEA